MRDDVRRVLRDARVGYTGLVVAATASRFAFAKAAISIRPSTSCENCPSPLGGILGSSTGQRNLDVTTEAGSLVRLTLTEPAILERIRQSVEQSIQIIERRVNELGTVEPLIQRQGVDRILVQVPGLQDPTRLKELLGKTAKLDFRMVDVSIPAEQALQGRVPPDSEILYSATPPKTPNLVEKRSLFREAISPMRSRGSISAPTNRSYRFDSIRRARANLRRSRKRMSAGRSPSFSTIR